MYSIGAIIAAAILAFLVRKRRPTFRWTVVGAALYGLWFVSWLTLVAPVNNEIASALEAAPATVPGLWASLRSRWEYGHAVGFVLELLGFCTLVVSVLVDTPKAAVDEDAR